MELVLMIDALLWIREIPGHEHGAAAGLLHQASSVFGVLMLVQVRDDHVGAFAGKRDRHRPADPTVPAGHHGDLPAQPVVTAIGILAMVRLVGHCRLRSRRLCWRC
jgi:hypothetical protein